MDGASHEPPRWIPAWQPERGRRESTGRSFPEPVGQERACVSQPQRRQLLLYTHTCTAKYDPINTFRQALSSLWACSVDNPPSEMWQDNKFVYLLAHSHPGLSNSFLMRFHLRANRPSPRLPNAPPQHLKQTNAVSLGLFSNTFWSGFTENCICILFKIIHYKLL